METAMRALATVLLLLSFCGSLHAREPRYAKRWFYSQTNLLVAENADKLVVLIERAGKAGYNGLMLADYKFNILGRMPAHYFKHVERVKAAAEKAGMEIIPAIFPIGYSAGVLAHDPNLAEGIPVKDAPAVVKGGVVVPESSSKLRNGDLEQVNGHKFVGFGFQDDPGKISFADSEIVHGGKVSCRLENFTGRNARITQRANLRPWSCHRISGWVRTRGFAGGEFRLLAIGSGGRVLTHFKDELKPDTDWKQVEVVFNTLESAEVTIYAGVWSGNKGTVWLDDLRLDELFLTNLLRRPGCPFTVASADGSIVFEEGKDFHPVRDEKLGKVPYAGEFGSSHGGPTIRLTESSRLKEGDKLKVTWHHPVVIYGSQVMCCLSEPKIYELLADQAKRVNELFHPKTFFFSHDEIRCGNWCAACKGKGATPGAQLAENMRRCVAIIKALNPAAEMAVWSDMFDPNHNAVEKFYLVDGPLTDSWAGLPKEMIIANWNQGKAKSLRWFADRGHRQIIAGYYDGDLSNLKRWEDAAAGVPNIIGFMYTTWQAKYDHLEEYGQALRR